MSRPLRRTMSSADGNSSSHNAKCRATSTSRPMDVSNSTKSVGDELSKATPTR